MRTREKSYEDYGLTKYELEIVKDYCKIPGPEEQYIIRHAAMSANPDIAKEIYNSLVHKQSYAKQADRGYIPMTEKDFYGYRRKAIHELYCIIALLRLGK